MVTLGDKVKDSVSGFKGVAVARHLYLQGCSRISIQPEVDKEGKLPELQTFDEPLLVSIKKSKFGVEKDEVGGPEKYSDTSRDKY